MFCLRSNRWQPSGHQRGAALVVALLVFALAVTLMVGLQRDFTLQMQRGSNSFQREQGWTYLRGAESLAALALRLDALSDQQAESPRDDLSEQWAQKATPFPLEEGGWLAGELEDLQGRFNINTLAGAEQAEGDALRELGRPPLTASQKQFIRLLQALDAVEIDQTQARQITDAVADYLDGDTNRRFSGAEDETYRNLSPPYRAANQALASISELRAVEGISPDIYAALAPLVTVWPREGAVINLHTAPVAVLRSLNVDEQLDPLSAGDGQRLAELRDSGQMTNIDALLADSLFTAGSTDQLRSLLTEQSNWFLLKAQVEIAGREQRLYSVLKRSGQQIESQFRSLGEL